MPGVPEPINSKDKSKPDKKLLKLIKTSNDQLIKDTVNDLVAVWDQAAEDVYCHAQDDIIERFITLSIPTEQQFDLFQFLKTVEVKNRSKNISHPEPDPPSISVKLKLSQQKDDLIVKASLVNRETDWFNFKSNHNELAQVQTELAVEKNKLRDVLIAIQQLSSILEEEQLYPFLIQKITEILKAKRCSVMLLDEESQTLSIKAAHGISDEIVKNTRVKVGELVAGRVVQEDQALWIKDVDNDSRCPFPPRDYYSAKSFFSVPLRLEDKTVGVVNVTEKNDGQKNSFSEVEFEILRMLTRQTGIALDNANFCNRLKELSITDPLTGLFNKRHFLERLEREISRARRYINSLSLIMIDLDGFKAFNDTRGHLSGDLLLKIFAKKLRQSFRDSDILCRFGGDEFGVILPETNCDQAKRAAEKITKAAHSLGQTEVTASLGIAEWQKNWTRNELIEKADAALEESKKRGKDQIVSNI